MPSSPRSFKNWWARSREDPPPVEPAAISDLVAALDPQAFTGGLSATPTDEFGILAYDLDMFLLEPSGIDGLIYPSIEEFINSLPAGAASVDADPVH